MLIIYDGECPFCRDYSRRLRLIEEVGEVILLDARSDDPRLLAFWHKGYDLDQGMIVSHEGSLYSGADGVALLARLCEPRDMFNRLNKGVLANHTIAHAVYPVFKAVRRVALWCKRVGRVRQPV